MVVGNWETKTFDKWYSTKLGLYSMDFISTAMQTGNAYERRILDALNIPSLQYDNQMVLGRLRVNIDGNTTDTIYEVKTSIATPKKPPKGYIEQVNVEMFGFGIRKAIIVFYELSDAEYNNYYLDIDTNRLTFFPIIFDLNFINNIYLPRFKYLCNCLDKGVWPCMNSLK